MSILLVVFMYAMWSSVFSLAKLALTVSPPLFLTAARMLLAGVALTLFLFFKNRASFRFSLKQFAFLCLLGVFSIYLTNALEFWSLQHLTAAKTCFIYSLSPFFAALFSYFHFGEKINGKKWLGMTIGFVGFLPVLAIQKGAGELLTTISFISWPELAMIAASACTAYGWILLRLAVKDGALSPLMANGVSMLFGGALALAHSFFIDPWSPLPVSMANAGAFMKGIAIMTLISNILCYNLYGFLLKRFTATFLSFMGLLSPVFASLNSWIFLNEAPSAIILGSTAVVSIGLWLIYSAELKQGYIRKEETAVAAQ